MNEPLIKVSSFDRVGSDERGFTYEYFHERYGMHLICFRKAGSVSGRHYHKGNSLTKDPEILVLCSGIITLNWRRINSAEMSTRIIEGPAKVEIKPYVWHEIISVTDCTFLELNSLSEHEADTYRVDEN